MLKLQLLTRVEFSGFALVLLMGLFYPNKVLITIITILTIISGIIIRLLEQKDLREAQYYVRINPVWYKRWTHRLPHFTLIFILLLFQEKQQVIAFNVFAKLSILAIGAVHLVINANSLTNFTSGFRSYQNGVKLPGRSSQLIPWRNVHLINADKTTLIFRDADREYSYEINPRDAEDLWAICEEWISHKKVN